jgi:hypothetical protein
MSPAVLAGAYCAALMLVMLALHSISPAAHMVVSAMIMAIYFWPRRGS